MRSREGRAALRGTKTRLPWAIAVFLLSACGAGTPAGPDAAAPDPAPAPAPAPSPDPTPDLGHGPVEVLVESRQIL
ncbi:MAG: hypothetical protein FJ087_03420 [Deltaproteobacteria bacterium]|nr:hypothetical protein [Deltaproteobacteria bacterium]